MTMDTSYGRSGSGLAAALAAALLLGCAAGSQQHKEGLALLDQGRYEEGLAKLDEATRLGPDQLGYRTTLITQRERIVSRLLASAEAERRAGRLEAARAGYNGILRLDAHNGPAQAGLGMLEADKRHLAVIEEALDLFNKGNLDGARLALKPVLLENPGQEEAQALLRRIDEKANSEALASPSLRGKFKKPVSLQLRDANLKMVFEALSRTSGINVLLDKDVKADTKTSIFVKDVSVEDAIDLILLQNQLEKKVVSDNTVFVYPNSPAKLKDYQDLKIRSFHLSNADPKQMLSMIKTLLKTKDIFIHEKTNSIVIRDTPDAIRLAERLIADQDSPEPEVMLEVEVLEVVRSHLSEIGIKLPDQLTLTAQGASRTTGTGTAASTALTIDDLRNINGAGIITSPALAVGFNLHSDHGDVNVLASPRIRAKNREKAKIMIGDRVPIITNAITPVATGSPVITGNVQYLDVGLKLEVEPDINPDNLVSIKVSMEVSSIAKEVPNTQSGTLAYQVGTRNASTVLRLRDGETQVLAGLINDQDRKTTVEVPYLGLIPVLGRLLSSHKNDNSKSEIVLSITPHVVRSAKVRDARELEYWSGTETTLRNAPVVLRPMGSVTVSSTNVQPGQVGQGGAPGQIGPRSRVPPIVPPPPAPAADAPGPAAQADAPRAAGVANDAAPLVLAWQGPNQAKVGDRISLSINSNSGLGIKSLGLLVGFDPAVLQVLDVAEGDLLKQSDPAANFNKTVDQESGQIVVDLASQSGVASRSGTVVAITFEVKAAVAESQINISRIVPAGADGEAIAFVPPAAHKLTLVQ
jgi:general secretion pathway protein D